MSEVTWPNARLTSNRAADRWVLTFETMEPRRTHGHPHRNWRSFARRIDAIAFARRKGIRLETP